MTALCSTVKILLTIVEMPVPNATIGKMIRFRRVGLAVYLSDAAHVASVEWPNCRPGTIAVVAVARAIMLAEALGLRRYSSRSRWVFGRRRTSCRLCGDEESDMEDGEKVHRVSVMLNVGEMERLLQRTVL